MSSVTASEQRVSLGASVFGLVRALRPRQWVKNVLVLAAPLAAGEIGRPTVLVNSALAFAAFCLAASAVYLINDVVDVESDRLHPTKRNRPIAAGLVPPRVAVVLAGVLVAGALAVSVLASPELLITIAVYLGVQVSYSLGLKDQPVVDICIVASGFLIRGIAGGVASGLPLSQWFLLAAAFGSLFMVAGKRYAEIRLAERTGARIRKSLERYSASYLRFVWALSATILIMTYGLWAFEIGGRNDSPWAVISMVPFVVAVLRYAVDVDGGDAGEPEEIALHDRVLQVLAVLWVVALLLSVYV
jgi:decaprenyl-phosphate phosphoribosyltransferase